MTKNINVENKSKKYLIFMLALIAVSVFSGTAGDPLQSMLASGVGGGFFAAICLNKFKVWTVVPVMVFPPVASYLITAAPEKAILSLSFIPVGIAVFYGIKKGLSRSQTIVRSISAMIVFYVAVYLYYIFILFGSVNGENIAKYIDLNLQGVRNNMERVKEIYAQMGVDVEKFFSKEILDEVIYSLRMSWLGYGLAVFGIFSFVASVIAKSAIPYGAEFKKEHGNWSYVLSKMGAVIFTLAYFAGALYPPENEGMYFPLAINTICIGMTPAVLYMGVSRIVKKLRSERRIFFLILILISLSFGNFAMLLLLIIGVYSSLTYEGKRIDSAENKED